MIEVYLFLAVFPVQILALSALYPARFARRIRAEQPRLPAERLAALYPEVDAGHAYEIFLTRYRAANTVIAVLGLLLLGWFVRYMQHPDWRDGVVSGVITAYFVLQNIPLLLIAWFVTRFNRVHRRSSPEGRRTAILQRRGLFDFVSPFTVFLTVLAYLQFAAFMFYIARDPFPGFAGPLVNIASVTLMYVLFAFVMYWMIRGRRRGPLETHANRMYLTSFVVKSYSYMCILVPIFLSLYFARKLLDLESWGPFARSVSFLILMLPVLRFGRASAPPRRPEADGLGSSPAH